MKTDHVYLNLISFIQLRVLCKLNQYESAYFHIGIQGESCNQLRVNILITSKDIANILDVYLMVMEDMPFVSYHYLKILIV